MRKTLTVTGVLTAALALPLLGSGTAYAADTSSAVDLAKAGGGCVTTYEANLLANKLGPLTAVAGYNVTVNGNNAVAYEAATVADTQTFKNCVY